MNEDMKEFRRMVEVFERLDHQQKERVDELYAMVEGYHIVFEKTLERLDEKRAKTGTLLADVKGAASQLVRFAEGYENVVNKTIRDVLFWVLGVSFLGGFFAICGWYLFVKYFLA